MKKIRIFILVFLVCACFTSCSKKGHWVKTKEGLKLFTREDSTMVFSWNGGDFAGVAHGLGTLTLSSEDGKIERREYNAFYGAVEESDIINIEKGRYVGVEKDGLMSGFGVLSTGKDLYVGYFADSQPDGMLNWYKAGKLYYEGAWKAGKFDGKGVLYKEDNTIKSGTWRQGKIIQTYIKQTSTEGYYEGYAFHGKPDGYGSMTYTKGGIYKGTWSSGKWDGKGTFVSETDSISGEWKKGLLSGEVYCKTPQFTYKGRYVNNKPNGFGEVATPYYSYDGDWIAGKMDGFGKIRLSGGGVYMGDWKQGKFNGSGRYEYDDLGTYYEGEWKNGLQNGLGEYSSDEFLYVGYWHNGSITGQGYMTYSNQDVYEGNFYGGIRSGEGSYKFANGNLYQGQFKDGQFHGVGVFQFTDGNRYEGYFNKGKIEGVGTLYLKNNITITADWDGTNKMPQWVSIHFSNGDAYEGEFINNQPTLKGKWTTAKGRDSGENISFSDTLHRANDFYKRHKATIDKVVSTSSAVLTAVEVGAPILGFVLAVPTGGASVAVGKSLGVAAGVANMTINNVDMVLKAGSVAIDVKEARDARKPLPTEKIEELGKDLVVNVAFIAAPKVITKTINSSTGKKIFKGVEKGALTVGNKVKSAGSAIQKKIPKQLQGFKIVSVSKDVRVTMPLAKDKIIKQKNSLYIKFESFFLKKNIPRTKLGKEVKMILAKGPLKLSPKEWKGLMDNPRDYLREFIKVKAGNGKKGDPHEFFIRLVQGDSKKAKELMEKPEVKRYIEGFIRKANGGGNHEHLMTKNYIDFLTNHKWGEDGPLLAKTMTELVQKTGNVKFKGGGGHGSSMSTTYHNNLSKVIESCNSKEELLLAIKKYNKQVLTQESYGEFNAIFMSLFNINK